MITSSESASSVDRQFQSVCEELRNINKSIPIILDDKKCTNLKQTIIHIQSLLRKELGISEDFQPQRQDEKAMSGDDVNLKIEQEDSSDSESEADN